MTTIHFAEKAALITCGITFVALHKHGKSWPFALSSATKELADLAMKAVGAVLVLAAKVFMVSFLFSDREYHDYVVGNRKG